MMKKSDSQRHQQIQNLTAQPAQKAVDAAIHLWEQLAKHLISIVGEGGFNSLYARSLLLAKSSYPWLVAPALPSQNRHRFAELRISFEAQAPEQTNAANLLLLITFTDILASLIGEQLTSRILNSAWGPPTQDKGSKEHQNE